ncbi:lipopolysaccharide kinase InaA family protein [Candidatus Hydrogenedentota bacterium]
MRRKNILIPEQEAPQLMTELAGFDENSWTSSGEHEEYLRNVIIPEVNKLDALPGAEIIKSNMVRTVLRVPAQSEGAPDIIVKYYNVRDIKEWVKHIFVKPKWRAEWKAATALVKLGIPTGRPLAFAEAKCCPSYSRGVLITQFIPGCIPMGEYFPFFCASGLENGARIRRETIRKIGSMIGAMHRGNVFHPDLHLGNILVPSTKPDPELYLIDLHAAKVVENLSHEQKLADLAKLVHSLGEMPRRADLYAGLRAYLAEKGDWKTLWREVQALTEKVDERRMASRTKRCLQKSSKFKRSRDRRFTIYRRRDWPKENFGKLLDEHNRIVKDQGDGLLKLGRKTAVTAVTLPDGTKYCFKKNRSEKLTSLFKNIFRHPRARQAWVAANGLDVREIDAPRAYAYVEERFLKVFVLRTYLVADMLGGVVALPDALANARGKARASAILRSLSLLLTRLRRKGVHHSDLSGKNILVDARSPDHPIMYPIDLECIRFTKRPANRHLIANLVQIDDAIFGHASEKKRRKIMASYAPELFDGPAGDHTLHTVEILRRQRRRRAATVIRKQEKFDAHLRRFKSFLGSKK